MKELFMSQEVRLNGMTQANEIRPNNPAMPLTQALEGIEDVDWTLCPDPELPVNGVSVSSPPTPGKCPQRCECLSPPGLVTQNCCGHWNEWQNDDYLSSALHSSRRL